MMTLTMWSSGAKKFKVDSFPTILRSLRSISTFLTFVVDSLGLEAAINFICVDLNRRSNVIWSVGVGNVSLLMRMWKKKFRYFTSKYMELYCARFPWHEESDVISAIFTSLRNTFWIVQKYPKSTQNIPRTRVSLETE